MTPDDAALRALIEPARRLALDYAARRSGLEVTVKGPGQLVTEADLAVEDRLRRSIREAFGEVPILGEEAGGALEAGSGWAIDPIDGTTNFLHGLPLWGVSAGLMRDGAPAAGVVALPELGLVLTAVHGQGAWRNGARLVRPAGFLPSLFALGENGEEPGAEADRRAEALRARGFTVVRYNCAVFSLAGTALGRLAGYVERGCSLWDIAAGWLIAAEAGVPTRAEAIGGGRWEIRSGEF